MGDVEGATANAHRSLLDGIFGDLARADADLAAGHCEAVGSLEDTLGSTERQVVKHHSRQVERALALAEGGLEARQREGLLGPHAGPPIGLARVLDLLDFETQ